MPFSHLSYRWVRNQNYDYAKRRRCFIILCLVYTITFAILGAIFLGVYIDKVNYLNSLNCTSACGWLSATINCGYQACCDSIGFIYSYQYCTGTYIGTYYLLTIIFFCYAAYEFFLMIATLCRGTALQNTDVIVINNQSPQYVGLNNFQQQQQIYQGSNQNQMQQQQMYQAQMQRQNQQQMYQGNNQMQMGPTVQESAK